MGSLGTDSPALTLTSVGLKGICATRMLSARTKWVPTNAPVFSVSMVMGVLVQTSTNVVMIIAGAVRMPTV